MTLAARENDIVTCVEWDHPMFRIRRDIYCGDTVRAVDFESLHSEIATPVANAEMPRSCPCGSRYMRVQAGGYKFHFKDGFH